MIHPTPFPPGFSRGRLSSRTPFARERGVALAKYFVPNILKSISLILLIFGIDSFASAQEKEKFTDTRDNHTYRTVKMGRQTWMAENLAWLPSVNRVATGLFEEECRYVYGYDGTAIHEAKANFHFREFGVLYNWMAARSACPDGWHLPSDGEWIQLEKYLGMTAEETSKRDWRISGEAGKKLKATSGWINGNGPDTCGFTALPAGCRGYAGYESKGYAAFFWTSSSIDGDNGWRRGICSDSPGISRQEDRRYFGCSVRCVKN